VPVQTTGSSRLPDRSAILAELHQCWRHSGIKPAAGMNLTAADLVLVGVTASSAAAAEASCRVSRQSC
jgi:hypothetical protein